MYVLITNDDGIYSKGIEALKVALEKVADEVVVVAPLEEKSGVGQSITYRTPLRVQKVRRNGTFFGYGVMGSPADCVKFAVKSLLPKRPDWIISGINHGYNFGFNLFYSGTVAGAVEGAIQGIPSLAVSTTWMKDPDYIHPARLTTEILKTLRSMKFPGSPVFNINIPAENPKGLLITRQSTLSLDERYSANKAPTGEPFYWLSGNFDRHKGDTKFDDAAILEGYISITPLQVERTCMKTYKQLQKEFKDVNLLVPEE